MEDLKQDVSTSENKDEGDQIEFNPLEIEKIQSSPIPLDLPEVKIDLGTEPESYEDFDKKIKIHCCLCGNLIEPNPANTCIICLKKTVDVTKGILLEYEVEQCRTCERWRGPPWGSYERESNEMMKLLMKKVKGITKEMKIFDAQFIWSEPHSKRMKIKLTLSKDVLNGVIMQKTIIITFHEVNLQCDECKKSFTPHTWNAEIQLRQRVDHKRTLLYLEQLILKNNAHDKCINIEEKNDGLNFYFKHRSHAVSLMEFIQNNIPTRIKQSSKVVSQDLKNNTSNTKHSISIEIVPICKDDLILLPQKLSREFGGIGPLVLCYKVSKCINVVDICTMDTYEIDAPTYWKNPFTAICDRKVLSTFVVMSIDTSICDVNESKAAKRNHFKFAEIELQKEKQTGTMEKSYFTKTHLGDVLNYDDTVLAYDLESCNLKDEQIEELENSKKQLPEVIIVRKFYPKTRAKLREKKRTWKLKRFDLNKESAQADFEESKDKSSKGGKKGAKQSKKIKKEEKIISNKDQDYEIFLQDLEEDKEMRSQIKLYKQEEPAKEPKTKSNKITNEDLKDKNEAKEENNEQKHEPEGDQMIALETNQEIVTEHKPDDEQAKEESSDEDENFPEITEQELE